MNPWSAAAAAAAPQRPGPWRERGSRLVCRLLAALAQTWRLLGRDAAAVAVLDRLLVRWPDDPHALASRCHLLAQVGCADGALTDARRLVALQPADDRAWFNLGFLLEAAQRWDEALVAFGHATVLNPQLDRAWYGQALVLIRLERLDEAERALKRNTALQPMSPHGWYQLARVQFDRGLPAEAMKVIRHLQTFEPQVAAQLQRETGLALGPERA